jgi:hypothetical protein
MRNVTAPVDESAPKMSFFQSISGMRHHLMRHT